MIMAFLSSLLITSCRWVKYHDAEVHSMLSRASANDKRLSPGEVDITYPAAKIKIIQKQAMRSFDHPPVVNIEAMAFVQRT